KKKVIVYQNKHSDNSWSDFNPPKGGAISRLSKTHHRILVATGELERVEMLYLLTYFLNSYSGRRDMSCANLCSFLHGVINRVVLQVNVKL
uniref:hypothetical protein n=1 Tax=Parabacteroides sp. AM08-6 TaxID=2292053 RepID=UPI000FEF001B